MDFQNGYKLYRNNSVSIKIYVFNLFSYSVQIQLMLQIQLCYDEYPVKLML